MKGNVHDTLHIRKPTALEGALVKGFEKQALPEGTLPVEGDDVIYMLPKMFERQVEVLMFVASAPAIPGKKHDLSSSSKLEFAVSYTGKPYPPQAIGSQLLGANATSPDIRT